MFLTAPGSTTTFSSDAETASTSIRGASSTTETPTEKLPTTEGVIETTTLPQSNDAKCVSETTGFVEDDVLNAEWAKMQEAIEADVRANLFSYYDLSEPACQVDAADYDDDYVAACEPAEGQVVAKSITAECSGWVGFSPVPEGLILLYCILHFVLVLLLMWRIRRASARLDG